MDSRVQRIRVGRVLNRLRLNDLLTCVAERTVLELEKVSGPLCLGGGRMELCAALDRFILEEVEIDGGSRLPLRAHSLSP